jgi:hypothetical protein
MVFLSGERTASSQAPRQTPGMFPKMNSDSDLLAPFSPTYSAMFNIVNTVGRILRDLLNYQLAKWFPGTQRESFVKPARLEDPIRSEQCVVDRAQRFDPINLADSIDAFQAPLRLPCSDSYGKVFADA